MLWATVDCLSLPYGVFHRLTDARCDASCPTQTTINASELLSVALEIICVVHHYGLTAAPAWLQEAASRSDKDGQALRAWLDRVTESKKWQSADQWYAARGAFFFPDLTLQTLYNKAFNLFDSKSG